MSADWSSIMALDDMSWAEWSGCHGRVGVNRKIDSSEGDDTFQIYLLGSRSQGTDRHRFEYVITMVGKK